MYYNVRVDTLHPFNRKRCVQSLKNIALNAIIKYGIKPAPYQLPEDLVDQIIKRRFRNIHPVCKDDVEPFVYDSVLIGINQPRISHIVYDDIKSLYMRLISCGRDTNNCSDTNNALVSVLSPYEDKFLNNLLLDYVMCSRLSYANIRQIPYCD
jgi:hypothetical protein